MTYKLKMRFAPRTLRTRWITETEYLQRVRLYQYVPIIARRETGIHSINWLEYCVLELDLCRFRHNNPQDILCHNSNSISLIPSKSVSA